MSLRDIGPALRAELKLAELELERITKLRRTPAFRRLLEGGITEAQAKYIAAICKKYPDRFSGLAGVDPTLGCDGVCDKSAPEDLPQAMTIVKQYLEKLEEERSAKSGKGIFNAVRSISKLINTWNHRLEKQEDAVEAALPKQTEENPSKTEAN